MKRIISESSLNNLKTNIINWYDFENTDSILLVGEIDEVIEQFLCKKFKKIVKYSNDVINQTFDYILMMNCLDENQSNKDIQTFIKKLSQFLNEEGKILVVLKNKLGAKEIVNQTFNGFSKERIKSIIKNLEFNYSKFYYLLPKEDCVNVIFSDEFLPSTIDIGRNIDFETKLNSISNWDLEDDLLIKTLKNYKEDFETISNGFFVELSRKGIKSQVKAVFFSNVRKDEYRIRTKILKDVAMKEAATENSIAHIKQIEKNIDILKNCKINTLDNYEKNSVISKLAINSEKLDDIFLKLYNNDDIKYLDIINRVKNEILKLGEGSKENNIFNKFDIQISDELLDKMTFIKNGLWDLTFRNMFLIDNELYTYDQEWYEENVPLEFILFRSIWQLENITIPQKMELIKKVEFEEFYEKFLELEIKLGEKINNPNTINVVPTHRDTEINKLKRQLDSNSKEIEIQNNLISCNNLINLDLKEKNEEKIKECNELQEELNRKETKINELQVAILSSKTLKCTRTLKKIVKKFNGFVDKILNGTVKFTYSKLLPKKIKKRLLVKARYSKKLSKLIDVLPIAQMNNNIKLYDRQNDSFTDVYLQFPLNKTIGIHLHLYYEDLADEFYRYLSNIPYEFDLYVSIRQGVDPNKIRNVFKRIVNLNYLEVVVSENSGRDFGPMFVLFAKKLKNYDYIMHIHSKKSLRVGNEQVDWRQYLLDNLLRKF